MKVTIDIDCTPQEARQFMGLPDVEPMQKAAMAEMEKRMLEEIEKFTPEALLKSWMPLMAQGASIPMEIFKQATKKT